MKRVCVSESDRSSSEDKLYRDEADMRRKWWLQNVEKNAVYRFDSLFRSVLHARVRQRWLLELVTWVTSRGAYRKTRHLADTGLWLDTVIGHAVLGVWAPLDSEITERVPGVYILLIV